MRAVVDTSRTGAGEAEIARMRTREVDVSEGDRLYRQAEWTFGQDLSPDRLDVAETKFYEWCCENVPALLAAYEANR